MAKQAAMQKNPDPNFEAIFQEIESASREPSEELHRLWEFQIQNSTKKHDSEEAFRVEESFSNARYQMMLLQEDFRSRC